MSRILVTGLNPAWQKILEFETLAEGKVNRASSCLELGSGKGLNAAIVLARLGHEVSLLQVVGGINGRRIEDYCLQSGIKPLGVVVQRETRVCSTLIDRGSGKVTELIEPFSVDPDERVAERLLDLLPDSGGWDALVVMGTAPAGIDPSIYAQIAGRVRAPLVLLDIVRELNDEVLRVATFVKVNAEEFRRLKDRGVDWQSDRLRWPTALVTDGPDPALLLENRDGRIKRTSFHLPPLAATNNPIGAGDTVTACLTDGLLHGRPLEATCRQALAAGSASCLTLLPTDYDEGVQQTLAAAIRTSG